MSFLDLVNNKYFALGMVVNITEWGKQTITLPKPPRPEPPTGSGIQTDDRYCWRPHVYSWYSNSSVVVMITNSKGKKEPKKIPFTYVNSMVGGIGGSGFQCDSKGDWAYRSGAGGACGTGNTGKSSVSDLIKRYQLPKVDIEVNCSDGNARCVIIDDNGYREFTPNYVWGRGTIIDIKPNMYLYLFGGDGLKISDHPYWNLETSQSTKGGAIGFKFDETVYDVLGVKQLEVINNQNAMMSTLSYNPRIFDGDYILGYCGLLCDGGRSCTLNLIGTNFNTMYACAGGGGGSGIKANDEYSIAQSILNSYANKASSSYSKESKVINASSSTSSKLDNLSGYTFTQGSRGLTLNVNVYGDVKSQVSTFSLNSDVNLELSINIKVELYSGEIYSRNVRKTVEVVGGVVLNDTVSIDLNAEFSALKLDFNSQIKSIETTLSSSLDIEVFEGSLMCTLVDFTVPEIANTTNLGKPVYGYSKLDNVIELEEYLLIEGLAKEKSPYVVIDDELELESSLIEVYSRPVIKPTTPDDMLGIEEFLIIE